MTSPKCDLTNDPQMYIKCIAKTNLSIIDLRRFFPCISRLTMTAYGKHEKTETAARDYSAKKKLFWKISHDPHENTCVRASF